MIPLDAGRGYGRQYTPRERFLCALARGQPDRVPVFDFLFSPVLLQEPLGRRVSEYTGVDAVVGEDLRHSSGPLFSLRHCRTLLRPYLDELVATIVRLGKPVLLHSCGRVSPSLDDVVEAGISALHPLQPTAGVDLEGALTRALRPRRAGWG